MWICKGCHLPAVDSDYLEYQLNVLHYVHLKDADSKIWFQCGHCKSVGHANCIYLKNNEKVMQLEWYICCHSKALQNLLQSVNKWFLYGSKLKEYDGN